MSGFFTAIFMVLLISAIGWMISLFNKAKSLPQDIADKSTARKLAKSEAEEHLYDSVRQEIESGEIRSGLWTKAEATAISTEHAAIRAKYIQLRFEQLEAQGQLNQIEEEGSVTSDFNTTGTKKVSETPEPKRICEPRSDEELMTDYGITFDGEYYHFDRYKYENLIDAVNYAKLQRPAGINMWSD